MLDTTQMTVNDIREAITEEFDIPPNIVENIKGKRNLITYWEKLEQELEEIDIPSHILEPSDDNDIQELNVEETQDIMEQNIYRDIPSIHDAGWTDYVLAQLEDDEKLDGNPTVDGLRRIVDLILGYRLIDVNSEVIQVPTPDNDRRATVKVTVKLDDGEHSISASGCADCYAGNTAGIQYSKHPVAMAETRAEGRALKRLLRLRKVISAEEAMSNEEQNDDTPQFMAIQQLRFLETMASTKLDINLEKFFQYYIPDITNLDNVSYEKAEELCKIMGSYENTGVPSNLKGYQSNWKTVLQGETK